jgi:hypothetical protein
LVIFPRCAAALRPIDAPSCPLVMP